MATRFRARGWLASTATATLIAGSLLGAAGVASADDGGSEGDFSPLPTAPVPVDDVVTTPFGTPFTAHPLANDAGAEHFHVSKVTNCSVDQGTLNVMSNGEQSPIASFTLPGESQPLELEQVASDGSSGFPMFLDSSGNGWVLTLGEDSEWNLLGFPDTSYNYYVVGQSQPAASGTVLLNLLSAAPLMGFGEPGETLNVDAFMSFVGDEVASSSIGDWSVDGDDVTFTPTDEQGGTACAAVWISATAGDVFGASVPDGVDPSAVVGTYPQRLEVTVTPKPAEEPNPGTEKPAVVFSDMKQGDKFFTEIQWMAQEGISTGKKQADGSFKYDPKGKVTREAMAAFLYRLHAPKDYVAPKSSKFTDVQPGDQFFTEIAWMDAEGISTGKKQADGSVKYDPKSSITREAMAAFMYRLDEGAKPALPASSPFTDMVSGDKFYAEIVWMEQSGLSTGKKQADGSVKYDPKGQTTREAMAAFLYRAAQ